MTVSAVLCEACGGAVAMKAGTSAPACLFCGEAALVPLRADQQVELPEQVVGFAIDEEAARAEFQRFSASSFWYPGDLKHAKVELRRILLPGWVWSARCEVHYNAVVSSGGTRSGKRPVTGADTTELAGILVPSSTAVSRRELQAVAPFATESAAPFVAECAEAPFEVASLTRVAARQAAIVAMKEALEGQLRARLGASSVGLSMRADQLAGHTLYFPVFIGAYRYRDRLYRVVLNGQSGELTGTAPISVAKVAMVAALVLALVVGALLVFEG